MIVKKTFKCNCKDIDSVVCAVAEEIKAGYTISAIRHDLPEISAAPQYYPTFEVVLERRKS